MFIVIVIAIRHTLGWIYYDFSGSKYEGNELVIMNEKLEEEKQIITG